VLAPFRGEAYPEVAEMDESAVAQRVLKRLLPDS